MDAGRRAGAADRRPAAARPRRGPRPRPSRSPRGCAAHVADGRAAGCRGAAVLLQLDEPSLPAVLAGRVPTESGLGTLPAGRDATVARDRAARRWSTRPACRWWCTAARRTCRWSCCATAGAAAVALDLRPGHRPGPARRGDRRRARAAGRRRADAAAVRRSRADVGRGRRPGTPALGPPRLSPPRSCAEQVVVTPACGLAGATPQYARAVLAACRDAGRRLSEDVRFSVVPAGQDDRHDWTTAFRGDRLPRSAGPGRLLRRAARPAADRGQLRR